MEIANGMVILSPENHQYKYGVTPPEALILYELHKVYANGSPLGEFFIQDGEAITIDSEYKPAQEEYFNQNTGKIVPAKPAVEAKFHKRTNIEEIDRLKKKYTGNITKNGAALPAFTAVFGSASVIRLPETFEEIEPMIGVKFQRQPSEKEIELSQVVQGRKSELLSKLRHELCDMAIALGLKVHPSDTKEAIATAIMAKESQGEPEKESKAS